MKSVRRGSVRGKTGASNLRLCILVGLLFCGGVWLGFVRDIDNSLLTASNNPLLWEAIESMNSQPSPIFQQQEQRQPNKDRVCPKVVNSYFDSDALRRVIAAKEDFHKFGGSLKSVQKFRDAAVDNTLKRLNLQFQPNDSQQPATQELMAHLKAYYAANYDPRGGYGQPLPGKIVRKGKAPLAGDKFPELMGERWVEPLEEVPGRSKWDAALGPIGPLCPNLLQLGTKQGDGYKYICMPMGYNQTGAAAAALVTTTTAIAINPRQSAFKDDTGECHVLSVGGNDNWKFEVAMADTLGCITHTFDCTLPSPDGMPRKRPKRDDIRFYKYCIDGKSYTDAHGRSYLTYADMLQQAGIVDQPPTYFKIDVEGFEFDIFSQMIRQEHVRMQESTGATKSMLPQQIQVELHWATRMTGVEWMARTRSAGEIALLQDTMYLGGGYLPIHLDFNRFCSPCMEVLFFKAVCDDT
jgi:hypothetical protein